MKQETLEEAAVINYKKLYEGEPLTQDVPIDAFKQGAKWQQEQDLNMVQGYLSANLKNMELFKKMYSEEEVIELLYKRSIYQDHFESDTEVREWFNKFKKIR